MHVGCGYDQVEHHKRRLVKVNDEVQFKIREMDLDMTLLVLPGPIKH